MNGMLVAGLGLAMSMAVGGAGLMRINREQKALGRRAAGFIPKGHSKAKPFSLLVRRPERRRGVVTRLAMILGYNPAKRTQYRFPWFIVLALCILAARVVVLVTSFIIGTAAWVLLLPCIILGARMYYAASDKRRRGLLLAHLPDALALIVRAVRVGVPVVEALQAVAREAAEPTRTEFEQVRQALTIGMPLDTALRAMADRCNLPEYGFFAAALSLQAQTGGGLTDTLETLADIIRRRIAMQERGHALSSEARTSTMVLGLLPIVTGTVLYLSSPAYIAVLFTEPAGKQLLGGAVLSLACGLGIMRQIIQKSLS